MEPGKRLEERSAVEHEAYRHYFMEFYGQTTEWLPLCTHIGLDRLVETLSTLRHGLTVISCHPGYVNDLKTIYGRSGLKS